MVFPALLFEVLLVEFFLFLRLVVGCLVGSAVRGKGEEGWAPGQEYEAALSMLSAQWCPFYTLKRELFKMSPFLSNLKITIKENG